MTGQIYDDYCNSTLEWTNFNSNLFREALRTIVDYIDETNATTYSKDYYKRLQERVANWYGRDVKNPSVRKAINTFVKLGFVNSQAMSYQPLARNFLNAESDEERKLLFSNIVYNYSCFKRTVTENYNGSEIQYVIKALEAMPEKKLPKFLIRAILKLEIAKKTNSKFDLKVKTKRELLQLANSSEVKDFAKRKKIQIGHFGSVLAKMDNVYYDTAEKAYFLGKKVEQTEKNDKKGRDSYQQSLFRKQLEEESKKIFGISKCMVEKISYPYLRASHIKPVKNFKDKNDANIYNPNNGLLLTKNLDALFDQLYISFDDRGNIIFYDRMPEDIKKAWKDYKIHKSFLNKQRKEFLAIHRELCEAEQSKKKIKK